MCQSSNYHQSAGVFLHAVKSLCFRRFVWHWNETPFIAISIDINICVNVNILFKATENYILQTIFMGDKIFFIYYTRIFLIDVQWCLISY